MICQLKTPAQLLLFQIHRFSLFIREKKKIAPLTYFCFWLFVASKVSRSELAV